MSSIGISKDGEAVWRSTGEPLAYTNFAQRVNGVRPCMSLLRDNGKWKEVNVCHFQFLKAICDKGKIMYNAFKLIHIQYELLHRIYAVMYQKSHSLLFGNIFI